jgi:DNA-binding transcriptional LysR family regulator
MRWFSQIGFKPVLLESVKATWMVINLSLVAAGAGLSILPDNIQMLQRRGVVYRKLQDISLIRYIAVVWRQTDIKDVLQPAPNDLILLRQFLNVVQEAAETAKESSSAESGGRKL